jgi:hypothetical protein
LFSRKIGFFSLRKVEAFFQNPVFTLF